MKALMPVPDDATSRKKTLWRTIFEGFDKIDGKPTRAEREVHIYNAELAYLLRNLLRISMGKYLAHKETNFKIPKIMIYGIKLKLMICIT